MKTIVMVLKKIVMALCMLYSFNLIIGCVGILIPINFLSIIFTSLFGLPAIFSLIVLSKVL